MPVVQEAFDIPVDIALGIATGRFKRIDGVVRVAIGKQKGQIVKHLKPIPVKNELVVDKVAKGLLALLKRIPRL